MAHLVRPASVSPLFYALYNSYGGLFLLHFPAGRPGRTLSVILLCDARTFLAIIPFGNISRDCPAQSRLLYIIFPILSRRSPREKEKTFSEMLNGALLSYKCSKIEAKIAKIGAKRQIFLINLDKIDKNSSILLQTIKNYDRMIDGEKRGFSNS